MSTDNPDKQAGPSPGPNPERLKIDEDDWEKAVEKALKKKRPEGGWPEPDDDGQDEEEPDDSD